MQEDLEYQEIINEIPLTAISGMEEPVLLTKANSVSEKLFLAGLLQRFDTIGVDAVASAVNDILAMGARPLAFSDMIICAKAKRERIKELHSGVEQGCILSGIRHGGSVIKELPDIFSYDQLELSGYAVGVSERMEHLQPIAAADGDVIIGLASNGLHNNGYDLARKKLYLSKASMEIYYESLGATLGDLLMLPTKLYKRALEAAFASGIEIKGCVQVTHGGLDTAVHKLLHNRAGAVIKQRGEQIPPLYEMLHKDGNISKEQLRESCNMGVGMLMIVAEENADEMIELLENTGETVIPLGLVERDSYTVRYIT